MAFFAGRRLGGPRVSPLSPAKRWSGTLCGAAAGLPRPRPRRRPPV
ncbi:MULTISPECIES: hypothetical protein [Streptomyces]